MFIRSKAPLRISFSGGGTDVPPYPEEQGGVVLTITINKYAYSSLIPRDDREITVQSLDYDIVAKYHADEQMVLDGELDLVKAVITRMNSGFATGLDLFIHTDAPPGSGLGSSAAMAVSLVGVLKTWLRKPLGSYDIADLALRVEREDLGIPGGKQDQYAAAFGGVNYIEFIGSRVIVNPLRVAPHVLNELEYRLLLCYTGQTRVSGRIIESQVANYVNRKDDTVRAMEEMKRITVEMKNALVLGEMDSFGELLNVAWENKKKMSDRISTPLVDEMYRVALANGALGGKLLGAGGGGYLLVYCPFNRKHIIASELERAGGQVVGFGFDFGGLQVWEVP